MPELRRLADNIWIADGPNVRDAGLLFTTRMTVVRLADGSVWVESPVSLPSETLEQIKGLGHLAYIVTSAQRHVWRLKAWHDLFPDAELWAPTGARFTLGVLNGPVNDVFSDIPAPGWQEDLEQLAFKGSSVLREVVFLHKASRTTIFGDLIQANPRIKGRLVRNTVFRALGAAAPKGGVAFDIRLSFRDRAAARESLDRLLSWDFDRAILAHGACIEHDAKSYVAAAFRWLLR